MLKPSDIDKTLGEVLLAHEKDTSFNLTFNKTAKKIIGNSLLIMLSGALFNYATNYEYKDLSKTLMGVAALVLMIGCRVSEDWNAIKFVDDFCNRRGLKREDYRDFSNDLNYTEELLNKKIRLFDFEEDVPAKPKKPKM